MKRSESAELQMLRTIIPYCAVAPEDRDVNVIADEATAIGPGGTQSIRRQRGRASSARGESGRQRTEETEDEAGLQLRRVEKCEELDVGDLEGWARTGGSRKSG